MCVFSGNDCQMYFNSLCYYSVLHNRLFARSLICCIICQAIVHGPTGGVIALAA